MKNSILSALKTKSCPIEYVIEHLPETTSTNTLLKQKAEHGERNGAVIIADRQTAGRGRLNRCFFSPDCSGLYMSILLRPSDIGCRLEADRSLYITVAAAVAVCQAIETVCDVKCGVKWVNDIYSEDGKKLCGILTEGALTAGTSELEYAILGIGINISPPKGGFPAEISETAGAIYQGADNIDLNAVKAKLSAEVLDNFSRIYINGLLAGEKSSREFIEEYRSRSVLNGKRIDVINGNTVEKATALEINKDCSLSVLTDKGEHRSLTYGEVRIRIERNES